MIKHLNDTIDKILREHPATRDADNLLTLKVWATQNGRLRDTTYTFVEFSRDFLKGKYSPQPSIKRVRAKLQELHPELRGENYAKRHGEYQEETRQEILNWNE